MVQVEGLDLWNSILVMNLRLKQFFVPIISHFHA